MTRVICDDGEVFTSGVAVRPTGEEDEFGPLFEDIVYPSGRTLEFLQAQFGPELYIIRDPA